MNFVCKSSVYNLVIERYCYIGDCLVFHFLIDSLEHFMTETYK